MKRALLPGLVLALLATATVSRAAEDDGGTTSLFSTGAGGRTLAMGGAGTANADGPWGWTWNPAGLAWLARAGADVSQSAPDAIGAKESQAAFAVPDWRWGALALTWRQFGVDGIDGRDDRGAPTASFSDRESELGVAYGRTVTDALGLGLAVKMRRHQLAGHSGGGLGADLGASFHLSALSGEREGWWRDLAVGVRAANVLRPSVRLDQEEVAEPSALSAGLAWHRASTVTSWTLAADVERVDGLTARPRLGAEFGLLGALDLRAGWDGERLSAGSGLRWRGLDVTWAYRNQPLGDEQRVSLGWRFGRTVAQAREQFAAEREQEVQRRLQVATDEDLARRGRELAEASRQSLAAGDLDDAYEKASVLNAISPGTVATDLLVRITAARAARLEKAGDWDGAVVEYQKALADQPTSFELTSGLARCRAESERRSRRGADQRRLYDGVLRGIAAGDARAARARLDSLRVAGLADSSLAPLVLRLERMTAAQLDGRLEQFAQMLQAGLLDDAASALDRARALAPDAPAVARARDQLARARQATARTTAAVPAPRASAAPAVSAASRREAEQLYQEGLTAMRSNKGDVALRAWELAVAKDPSHARAKEQLKREYQTRGLQSFAGGHLSDAENLWRRALQLDPADARTRSYLERAQEHLSRSAELGVSR